MTKKNLLINKLNYKSIIEIKIINHFKGFKLSVYDINKSSMTNLIEAGATGASSPSEISKNSEVIITMLPSNDHVWQCYTSEDGLLNSANKNTLFIDSSTIDPSVSQNIHKECVKKDAEFIDGPVSGGN